MDEEGSEECLDGSGCGFWGRRRETRTFGRTELKKNPDEKHDGYKMEIDRLKVIYRLRNQCKFDSWRRSIGNDCRK